MKTAVIILSVIFGAMFLYILFCIISAAYFYKANLIRKKPKLIQTKEQIIPEAWHKVIDEIYEKKQWLSEQEKEQVQIKSKDNLTLCATYFTANKKTDKTVLCVHGYESTGFTDFCLISQFYLFQGYNLLIIDQRAHGFSQGKYICFGQREKDDVRLWVDFLVKEKMQNSIALHGISMGSATVMCALENLNKPQVRCAIADCGYSSTFNQFSYILKTKYHLYPNIILYFANIFAKMYSRTDIMSCSPENALKNCTTPVLFFHGGKDNFVPTHMVYDLYSSCSSQKQLVIVNEASHALCHSTDAKLYENNVKAFLEKYM